MICRKQHHNNNNNTMKTIKNYAKMAAVAAVLSTGFASCSSDDDANTSTVSGTQAALEQACAQWRVARADWENSEAFLFGAADLYSIDPHTDTWPVDANALAGVLRDAAKMSNLDEFLKTANSSILGYHGIEYVLFREGKARDISQITSLEYNYVCAVAKDLYNATATLEATWDPSESNAERHRLALEYINSHNALDEEGDVTDEALTYENFGKEFTNPGAGKRWETSLDATREILSGCVDIIGEVGDSKIGLPYTGQDKSYIESPYAYNSIVDFYDNIISCKNALYGSVGATTPNSNSVIYFCLNSGNAKLKSQAESVMTALDAALAKIQSMKAPFALYYTDASCGAAMDALGTLGTAVDELNVTLGEYAGNATVEAQCKAINSNYVTNVVVATYRSLANNAQSLYQAIVRIRQ